MPINTRAKKREITDSPAEYAINEETEKTIKFNIPDIKYAAAKDVFVKSTLLDISVIGCALDSKYLIPPGVILDVSMDCTPFTAETAKERKLPLKATGTVRSCTMKSQGHYRLGVKFTKISKEDKDLIGSFIEAKERRKAPRWDMTT